MIYEYYFGTRESLDIIRGASRFMLPGFPRLVSLSGNALVHWPLDEILDFLGGGLDYFVKSAKSIRASFSRLSNPKTRNRRLKSRKSCGP